MTHRRWRILEPIEVGRVARAFGDERARTMFLVLMLTALRNSELQALRWRDVDLVDYVLRVRASKSEDGVRSIALTPTLAEALWQHRRGSAFQGSDESVFADPKRGARLNPTWLAEQLRGALTGAGWAPVALPAENRSTILRVPLGDLEPARVVHALSEHRVIASARDGALRFSVHLYNHEDDIERLVAVLGSLGRPPASPVRD